MALPETMYCLGCGYDLRGLRENRCPECGRAFDPADSESFSTRLTRSRPYLVGAVFGAGLFFAGLGVSLLEDRGMVGGPVRYAMCAMMPGLLLSGCTWGMSLRALRGSNGSVDHRWPLRIAVALGSLVCATFLILSADNLVALFKYLFN